MKQNSEIFTDLTGANSIHEIRRAYLGGLLKLQLKQIGINGSVTEAVHFLSYVPSLGFHFQNCFPLCFWWVLVQFLGCSPATSSNPSPAKERRTRSPAHCWSCCPEVGKAHLTPRGELNKSAVVLSNSCSAFQEHGDIGSYNKQNTFGRSLPTRKRCPQKKKSSLCFSQSLP